MSRFAICSAVVVLCAVQFVCAKNWEGQSLVDQVELEQEVPKVLLSRFERSSKSRKPDAKAMKAMKKATRGSPAACECKGQSCTCCGKITIDGKTEQGCSSFKVPDGKTRNQMVRYSYNFNDQQAQQQAPAGRDPRGVCKPYPGYQNVYVCSRWHSTQIENGKVRFCLTMDAKYHGYTFYQMDFDCVTYDVQNQQQVGN